MPGGLVPPKKKAPKGAPPGRKLFIVLSCWNCKTTHNVHIKVFMEWRKQFDNIFQFPAECCEAPNLAWNPVTTQVYLEKLPDIALPETITVQGKEYDVLEEWNRITPQLDLKTLLDLLDNYTSDEEKADFVKQWHWDDEQEEES